MLAPLGEGLEGLVTDGHRRSLPSACANVFHRSNANDAHAVSPVPAWCGGARGRRHRVGLSRGTLDQLGSAAESPGPGQDDPPPLPDATVEELRWAHRLEGTETAHLTDVDEPVSLPTTLEIEFRNDGTDLVQGNPYDWRVFKLVDEQWYPIRLSRFVPLPSAQLRPGERHEHVLRLDHHPMDGATANSDGDRDDPTLGGIGGGRYAFYLSFAVDEEVHASTFRVEAPAIELELPPDIGMNRDGREASISHGLPHEAITLVQSVEPTGDPVRQLIPEQLAQPGVLERPGILAIRAYDSIERVFVRHRSSPGRDHHRIVAFDGDTYRMGPVETPAVPDTPDHAEPVVSDWFRATEDDRDELVDKLERGYEAYEKESYVTAAERFNQVAGDYGTLRRDWGDHAATYPRDRQADELFGDVDRYLEHRERYARYVRYAAEIRAGEFASPFKAAGKEGDANFWEDQARDRCDRAAERLIAVEDAVPGIP